VFIDRFNNDYVKIAPCCQATANIESVTDFDFHTSPTLNKIRLEFTQGLKPAECNMCWTAEKLGHKSRRQSAIEFFNLPSQDQSVQLESIDHSATWACNMACVMCSPYNSSLWATELDYKTNDLIKIGRKFQKDNDILTKLDLSCVKKVHYNGGEPLLNNHQLELLEILEEQQVLKNLFISYNTNGSVFPNKKIIEHWARSRLVKLFFSIDATESAFEYIRWPGKWSQVSDNIQRMRDQLPSNVMFGINLTVGNYNVLELKDLWKWFKTNIHSNREGDLSDFNWQIAKNFDPLEVNLKVKQQVIKDLADIEPLSGIVDYLNSSDAVDKENKWINTFDTYDQKRNTNWRKSLKISEYY
jgi:sulfatase maturation enzyme AslB (radical SAM superfamily)